MITPWLERFFNGDEPPRKLSKNNMAWELWLAENLWAGVDANDLKSTLIEQQWPLNAIDSLFDTVLKNPWYQSGLAMAFASRKAQSLLQIKHQLQQKNPLNNQLDELSKLSAADFIRHYHAAWRPFVLRQGASHWLACQRWTLPWLNKHFGTVPVTYQCQREESPQYQREFESCCTESPLGDLIEWIEQHPVSNDRYLAAQCNVLKNTHLVTLLQDVGSLPEFLNPNPTGDNTFFWLGPSGTNTQLHHDWQSGLLTQIAGEKRIKLISPYAQAHLKNTELRFSDCTEDEIIRWQNTPNSPVTVLETVLRPGDMVYIPVGWWHSVTSLSISISLTFTNFITPNQPVWQVATPYVTPP